MAAQNLNWTITHFHRIVGAVPEPGREWVYEDSELDRSHLAQLSDRGLIVRTDYNSQTGTTWETSQAMEPLLERAARSRGVDADELFLVLTTPVQASIAEF